MRTHNLFLRLARTEAFYVRRKSAKSRSWRMTAMAKQMLAMKFMFAK